MIAHSYSSSDDPPPLPAPLPVPRYERFFTQAERRVLQREPHADLTQEVLFVRSQMDRLLKGARPGISPARLMRIVDLFSLAAVRLAHLLVLRRKLHARRVDDPFAKIARQAEEFELEMKREAGLRSSEDVRKNISIENPLRLIQERRQALAHLLYPGEPGPTSRGHPSADRYAVLEGILHKLLTDTPWSDLPSNYPQYTTCHRYYRRWQRTGLLDQLLAVLVAQEREWERIEDQSKLEERAQMSEAPRQEASEV